MTLLLAALAGADGKVVGIDVAAAVRPGGVVAIQDIDYTGGFCHPPCAAFDHTWDICSRTVHHAGGDATIAR